jgi:hypothetical protein
MRYERTRRPLALLAALTLALLALSTPAQGAPPGPRLHAAAAPGGAAPTLDDRLTGGTPTSDDSPTGGTPTSDDSPTGGTPVTGDRLTGGAPTSDDRPTGGAPLTGDRLTGGGLGPEIVLALAAGPGVLAELPGHQPPAPDRTAKKLAATTIGPETGTDRLRLAPVGIPTWAVRATGGPVRAGRAPPGIA